MELYLIVTLIKCAIKQNYVRIHANITSMKEKLIIIIKLSLRKRQIDYKKANWLQKGKLITNFGNKNNSSKKKKKDNSWLYFYYKLVFCWSLSGLGSCCCPLDSSLAGIAKVAKTSSWLWETIPSSEESLSAFEGFVVSRATSLGFSFSSQLHQLALPLLEDYWEEEGPWLESYQWSLDLWGLHHPRRLRSLVPEL